MAAARNDSFFKAANVQGTALLWLAPDTGVISHWHRAGRHRLLSNCGHGLRVDCGGHLETHYDIHNTDLLC